MSTVQATPAPVGIRQNTRFLRYWAGHAVSAFGDQVSALGLPLIAATMLDASPGEVGTLTAAVWAPNLLSLFVGTWADRRRSPRALLIAADLLRAGALVAVPVGYGLDALSMPFLYAAALVLGAGGVVYGTSYPRFFVRVVARRQYVAANSLLSTTGSISSIGGPAVGGALIQALSAPVALLVDAVSFVVSAIAVGTVRPDAPPATAGADAEETFGRRLRSGVSYLRRHPYLRASLACSTTMNFAAFVVQALLVLYATRHLHLSAGRIGLALGLGAVGGLLGAATAGTIGRMLGTGRTIALGSVLYCLPFAALVVAAGSPARGVLTMAAVELVSSFGVMLYDINNNALRTTVTRDDMRSRVSGAYSTVNYGIRPLGALAGGFLADAVGIPVTLVAAGAIGALSVAWLLWSPVIRLASLEDAEAR